MRKYYAFALYDLIIFVICVEVKLNIMNCMFQVTNEEIMKKSTQVTNKLSSEASQ